MRTQLLNGDHSEAVIGNARTYTTYPGAERYDAFANIIILSDADPQ